MKKYGPVEAKSHYMEFDTICDATQVCALASGSADGVNLTYDSRVFV
jgi:4-hydroxy-3-methylbut-2-en-1-yl diphosphate reductase